jgi:1-deoxy-D-xylulose-5-phosphate reductoisomerase
LAQTSPPDMKLPIALGLAWPERVPGAARPVDWSRASTWEFFPLDDDAFPAVGLAKRVGQTGGTYPAVYNAANEECVGAFHAGRIRFTEIVDTVVRVVDEHVAPSGALTLADVLSAEAWARVRARAILDR